MNKENAKEFLPLVQALADGKTIQWKTDSGNWKDGLNLGFNLNPEDYRIKPEPRTFMIYVNKHTHQASCFDLICHQNRSDSNWERITVQEVLK